MEFKDFDETFDDFMNLKKFISMKHVYIGRHHKFTSSKPNIHLITKCSCLNCPFNLNYKYSNGIYKPKKETFKAHTCLITPYLYNSHSHSLYYKDIIKDKMIKDPLIKPITFITSEFWFISLYIVKYDYIKKEMSKIRKDKFTDLLK